MGKRKRRAGEKKEQKSERFELEWPSEYRERRRELMTDEINEELCALAAKVSLSIFNTRGVRDYSAIDRDVLLAYCNRVQHYMELGYEIGCHKDRAENYRNGVP